MAEEGGGGGGGDQRVADGEATSWPSNFLCETLLT